jgi:hypothetical protein
MPRRFQFVAILVISLLAAQPAIAGLTCAMANAAAVCTHHMPAMAADCPMHQSATASFCQPDCCSHAQPVFTAPFTAAAKPKLALLSQPSLLPAAAVPTHATLPARVRIEVFAPTPPRYILQHAFRI